MDSQLIIFDLGWVFFLAWSTALTVVAIEAFGRDILRFSEDHTGKAKRL
jgi:hypothetical protein